MNPLPKGGGRGRRILELEAELAILRLRCQEAEATLEAIRGGEVDALVVRGDRGHEVYTLSGAERPYRRLVEVMSEGAAILVPDGTILYTNHSLAEMLHQAPGALTATSFLRFVEPARRAELIALLEERGTSGHRLELELLRPGGESVPALVSAAGLKDEQVPGVCLIVTDLTEQRRNAATRASEARLRSANEVLREDDKKKDQFLAMLAHELRNPLAPISTALQLLKLRCGERNDLRAPLEVLSRQSSHLTRLIDDLLEVSRISRGKIRLERELVTASLLVHRAVEISRPWLERKGHRLTVSLPGEDGWIDADATRMAQVLSNLLNNSAKYTDDGGHVLIAVELSDSEVRFRVEDDGRGIEAELLPRVFDLFVQADASLHRSEGGLGVGLTLVRGLVELHDGSVTARSDGPGRGSEFVVTLPRQAAVAAVPAAPPAPVVAQALKILVVDDNPDTSELMGTLLEMAGHEVRTASDGPRALERAREWPPQVVLLDIGLPGLDGHEVARRLRREQPQVVLIAVTGYGREEDRRRSREAGFDHHLVKPVDLDALTLLLSTGLPRQGAAAGAATPASPPS